MGVDHVFPDSLSEGTTRVEFSSVATRVRLRGLATLNVVVINVIISAPANQTLIYLWS